MVIFLLVCGMAVSAQTDVYYGSQDIPVYVEDAKGVEYECVFNKKEKRVEIVHIKNSKAKLEIPSELTFKGEKYKVWRLTETQDDGPEIGSKSFRGAAKGIRFYVKNKQIAKQLKKNLKGSNAIKFKIIT